MKLIHFYLDDGDYEKVKKLKGGKTWAEFVTSK